MATSCSTSSSSYQENKNIFIELSNEASHERRNYLFGESETEVLEDEEAASGRYFRACRKNPGHKMFTPIKSFSIQHLPLAHQDKLLLDFIRVTAELTVKLDVKIISPRRPQFWAKTTIPYPFYQKRGAALLRVGTGRVWNVLKKKSSYYQDKDVKVKTCPCLSCQSSDTPSTVWWDVEILTAAHVVFDDIEAKHTACRLFYDCESSPAILIHGQGIFSVDAKVDISEFVCVTCDRALAKTLSKMVQLFDQVWDKVSEKYKSSRDVDNLTFIVSHPHGGPKLVSIGQWVDKHQEGKSQDYKFTYTTSTCPGSSGAPANTVGFSWWTQQFHSGSLSNGLNSSTVSSIWKC